MKKSTGVEIKATNIALGIISLLSFALAFISERYRTTAIIIAFILLIIVLISTQEYKIAELGKRNQRLEEKLKIHEQLIEIKKDRALLKEKNTYNEKRSK